MIGLVQRVARAKVTIAGSVHGEIGPGLVLLLCAERGDGEAEADRLLSKLLKLRIFSDAQGKMNLALPQTGGGLLVVSQFTLAADTSGGNRPGFGNAAPPDIGRRLYEHFLASARAAHPVVETGDFGADMQVELVNDGPVTIPLRIAPGQ